MVLTFGVLHAAGRQGELDLAAGDGDGSRVTFSLAALDVRSQWQGHFSTERNLRSVRGSSKTLLVFAGKPTVVK
jgi:hypothetical protein